MRAFLKLIALSAAVFWLARGAVADDIFVSRIRPLLEKKCLSCHNTHDLKGGLLLESAASLQKGGESGSIVSPGHPDASYLLDLITPTDGKAAMPKGSQPLSRDEIDAVRQWIQQGALWPDQLVLQAEIWWSLKPLLTPAIPATDPLSRVDGTPFVIRNPVDAFVAQQLQDKQLQPAVEADRRTLIRRLCSDLIGLPPTPEQIEKFVNDPDPQAYEMLVESLLNSPQYGERWARHWLDVVKYADTCGYDKDQPRKNAWPYRDYVIRSFNQDKPYSRFIEEQVAGDILFPGTPDGILGLGFIAAGPWDLIGHTEVSEAKIDGKIARMLDRDEMVSSTLNSFCSATIQCARCHDHKFDPYTQAHYYGLQSVFAAVDRADRAYDIDPEVERRRLELEQQLKSKSAELAAVDQAIKKEGGDALEELAGRIKTLQPAAQPTMKDPKHGYHSLITADPHDMKWVQLDFGRQVDLSQIVLHACHDDFAGIGSGFGFPVRFRIQAVADVMEFTTDPFGGLIVDRTSADVANPGLSPVEFSIEAKGVRYLRVVATQLVERKQDFIFALAELQALDTAGGNVAMQAAVTTKDSIEAPVRWSARNLTDGIWPQPVDADAAEEYARVVSEHDRLLTKLRTPERQQKLKNLKTEIETTRTELKALPTGQMVHAAATHFSARGNFQATQGQPRPVHVLHRGNVQEPRELAVPGTIPGIPNVPTSFDLPGDHSEGDRRAELARWITRRDNPLTWRSIVNRVWQYHFGEGIVTSPNDFGRMGQLPTHPELLNWLAAQFRDEGQSFKQLHRLLVTSSTYRQSSAHHVENAQIDGSNRALWRMNRRRMEAEEIRDAILSVSGCLDEKMGGPGYYLFVIEKPEHSPHYEYQLYDPADRETHRRSIYRFIVRSQPDPFLTTLDCADSSQSIPQRNETVTALQALALLNNRFNLFMSERFAGRLQAHSGEQLQQIRHGFELIVGRVPTSDELNGLEAYAREFGMPNLCRMLFNLNEFVYID